MFGLSEADALIEATAPHRIVRAIHSGKLRYTFMGELYADQATQPTPACLSAMCTAHPSQDSGFPAENRESARQSGPNDRPEAAWLERLTGSPLLPQPEHEHGVAGRDGQVLLALGGERDRRASDLPSQVEREQLLARERVQDQHVAVHRAGNENVAGR